MKSDRRRKTKTSVLSKRGKSIAQRYVELLRLRDLVNEAEQKSAKSRR
jgi:hypothetical protein